MWSVRRIIREIKFFFQRIFRGWDDSECWNLDHTFAGWIIPRLEILKKNKHGVPSDMFADRWGDHNDEEMAIAEAKWNNIIDEMIYGFKIKKDQWEDNSIWDSHDEAQIAANKKGSKEPYTNPPAYERAKQLFAEYLDNLWD